MPCQHRQITVITDYGDSALNHSCLLQSQYAELQSSQEDGLRPAAQNLNRQDSKIGFGRARQIIATELAIFVCDLSVYHPAMASLSPHLRRESRRASLLTAT